MYPLYKTSNRYDIQQSPPEEPSSFAKMCERISKPLSAVVAVSLFFLAIVLAMIATGPSSPPPPRSPPPPASPPAPIQPIYIQPSVECSTYLTEIECRTWANNEGRTNFIHTNVDFMPKGCSFAMGSTTAYYNSHPNPTSTCDVSVHVCVCGQPVMTPK